MSGAVKLREQNEELRGFVTQLMAFLDPAERQYTCTKMCPAYEACIGSKFCEFPNWAHGRMRELGIEEEA